MNFTMYIIYFIYQFQINIESHHMAQSRSVRESDNHTTKVKLGKPIEATSISDCRQFSGMTSRRRLLHQESNRVKQKDNEFRSTFLYRLGIPNYLYKRLSKCVLNLSSRLLCCVRIISKLG